MDDPRVEGAVLLGDAAGYTGPIVGQGLLVTFRDVRLVRDTCLATNDWSPATFAGYCDERRERVRRIMLSAPFSTQLLVQVGDDAERARALTRLRTQPQQAGLIAALFMGPEALRSEVFTDAYYQAMFAP